MFRIDCITMKGGRAPAKTPRPGSLLIFDGSTCQVPFLTYPRAGQTGSMTASPFPTTLRCVAPPPPCASSARTPGNETSPPTPHTTRLVTDQSKHAPSCVLRLASDSPGPVENEPRVSAAPPPSLHSSRLAFPRLGRLCPSKSCCSGNPPESPICLGPQAGLFLA